MSPKSHPGVRSVLALALAAALGLSLASRALGVSLERPPIELGRMNIGRSAVTVPTRGGDIAELTLDPRLEQIAARLLEHAHPVEGAVVALDPRSGRILVWSERRRRGARDSVVTAARAPAASVFKLVTTAALFEAGGLHPGERVCISGGLRTIERKHLDLPTDGEITCGPFSDALGHSRNAVFAQLATRRLLRGDLITIAERLGFNATIPFDWDVPVGHLSVPYNDLAFARTAAGFQGSTLSPLGGAYLASVIASGGLSHRLKLVARTRDYLAAAEPELVTRVLSATTAWRMIRMMEVTIHSGTCRPSFTDETGRNLLPGIRVAGKTGTLRPETRGPTTSWFIGFAPSRNPEIVVSVLLQNGVVWRKRAAEVARDVFRAYFHGEGIPGIDDPLAVAARE
jgi:cell division protein FtsI/penicillin-binding protein 2